MSSRFGDFVQARSRNTPMVRGTASSHDAALIRSRGHSVAARQRSGLVGVDNHQAAQEVGQDVPRISDDQTGVTYDEVSEP